MAIDSSSPTLGLAALVDGVIVEHVEEPEASRHVETIVPLLHTLLKRCAWSSARLTAVTVAEGPGSFTGLRIGMAAAKAIALAHGAAVVSVRTLEAWAITELFLRGAIASSDDANGVGAGTGDAGPTTDEEARYDASLIVPVLDARKQRFYAAAFRAAPPGEGSMVRRITDDHDISVPELTAMVAEASAAGESWCAPGPSSCRLHASLGAQPARAAGGSAVLGVALRGYRRLHEGVVDDAYHGPFYLREGDIGSRRLRPVFTEAPRRDTEK
ncbi:MAG: tRNA (adenosine(37)-N6)-threonylcarbamoyltransferase complex dimerization subunit type 1 TsaB [Spirochaetales bacterium]|nr:tRNA (adenosine(37)-N6)-threonylcarbamoyltransferase complex dimerization subunit type 1 TsaB [Spirochaetales bacterium]